MVLTLRQATVSSLIEAGDKRRGVRVELGYRDMWLSLATSSAKPSSSSSSSPHNMSVAAIISSSLFSPPFFFSQRSGSRPKWGLLVFCNQLIREKVGWIKEKLRRSYVPGPSLGPRLSQMRDWIKWRLLSEWTRGVNRWSERSEAFQGEKVVKTAESLTCVLFAFWLWRAVWQLPNCSWKTS